MPRSRDRELLRAVGQRVSQARRDRGFTQEGLAEVVGIEPVTLSRSTTHRGCGAVTGIRHYKITDPDDLHRDLRRGLEKVRSRRRRVEDSDREVEDSDREE